MNYDAPDVPGRLQPHPLPGLSAIERLVRSIAPGGALPVVRFARSDPDDRRVGRRNRDVADRRYAFLIEDRLPGCAIVGCFPNATRSGADVHDVRIALYHGEIIDAPAHRRGANLAEFQILEFIRGTWLVGGRSHPNHRQRAERGSANQNRLKSIPRMLHFHPPVCKECS